MALQVSLANGGTFPSIAHTTTASTVVTLTPDFTSDSVFAVKITGPNANQFSTNENLDGVNGQQTFGGSTLVTAPTTFNVTFAPTAAGTYNATLEVHYNGDGSASTSLTPLTATAT